MITSFISKILTVIIFTICIAGNGQADVIESNKEAKRIKVFVNHTNSDLNGADFNYLKRYGFKSTVRYIQYVDNIKDADFELKLKSTLQFNSKRTKFKGVITGIFAIYTPLFSCASFCYGLGNQGSLSGNEEFWFVSLGAGLALLDYFLISYTFTDKIKIEFRDIQMIDIYSGNNIYIEKLKIKHRLKRRWADNYYLERSGFFTEVSTIYMDEITEILENHFKEKYNEKEIPAISYNNKYSKAIRASNLKIPLQLSDDVELNKLYVSCSESGFSRYYLLGGYREKSITINLPLKIGDNTIEISVEDWIGNKTKEKVSIYALHDSEKLTYTLGNIDGSNLPVPEYKLKEDINVDILPKTNMTNPNGVAIVIGNKNYNHIAEVEFAHNDATSIEQFLINTIGYSENNIISLRDASKSDFETIFGNEKTYKGKLYNLIEPNKSNVFIYYSGHGVPSLKNQKGYLAPKECDRNYIELSGYSLETLYQNIAQIPSASTVLFMDACFSGVNIYDNISPFVIKVENPLITKDNTHILTSSKDNQVSSWFPEKKHGLFTYFFLEAIHNKNADHNQNSQITLKEIHEYINNNNNGIPYYARRMHNIEQNPQLFSQDSNYVMIRY